MKYCTFFKLPQPTAKLNLQLHNRSNHKYMGSAAALFWVELLLFTSVACHSPNTAACSAPPCTAQAGKAERQSVILRLVSLLLCLCCLCLGQHHPAEHGQSCRGAWRSLAAGKRTKRYSNLREKGQEMILAFFTFPTEKWRALKSRDGTSASHSSS